ncbi:MAG: beta strand repeat-containing protein [Maribacter sp.]
MLPTRSNFLKFPFFLLFAATLLFSLKTNAQCGFGWNNSGVTVTPTAGSQFTSNIQAGEYFLMNVVNGGTYTLSTCSLGTWDTQLSLYNQTTTGLVAYNDDACANFRSQTSFTATFTGQVRVILNEYNCNASGNTSQVEYYGTIPGPQLTVGNVTVDEDAGTMTFTVDHTGAAVAGPYLVTFNTADVSAVAGVDYTGITGGTLNFDGSLGDSDDIIVSISDDSLYEVSETFTIQFSATTDSAVDITDTATGTIDDDEVIFNNPDLVLTHEFDGYIGYTSTGGSLRTQPNGTNACSISTSSSNTLTSAVPAGATIDRAFLYWAHSGASPDSQVTFEGNTVDADVMYTSAISGGRIFFGGVSDVTTIVAGIANPTTNSFDFSGLTIDTSSTYCPSRTVLGGWSLMVFYSDLSLPASTINVYQGFHGESNTSSTYTLDGFFAIGATGSKTTVLSWEGDQDLSNNEDLEVTTGLGTFDLVGDGDNTLFNRNPFNSTIFDNTGGTTVNDATTYGVDLDTYNVSPYITAGESSLTTRVESGTDFVMLNAVVLKVPSNLVTGTVFEDNNYGGGLGRDLASSLGMPIENVDMELYDITGTRIQTATTDATGDYVFGGMANGTYSIRAINNTISSTRGGGASCGACMPVQTFKTDYVASVLIPDTNAVGGENPSGTDPSANTLTGAQSVSSMTIANEGVAGMDFGFNFNTIVNTNEDGQGSLEQFIVNSNALDASSLDIVANSIFNPAAGEDTSIFMIPPTSDAMGRTADVNFASGYFDILISSGNPLSPITGSTTVIDGRTQTSYSGDTNAGTIGSGGTAIGTSGTLLPSFELPEIQVHRDQGDVLQIQGDNDVIRNLAVYASNRTAILFDDGSGSTVSNSLLGVNAIGANAGNVRYGVEIEGTSVTNLFVTENYIATTGNAGIFVNGGTGSKTIQGNHIFDIGDNPCDLAIDIRNGSSGVLIQNNLIENTQGVGIKSTGPGGVNILENTITGSGQNTSNCAGNPEHYGISLIGSNSQMVNNVIYDNGGAGLVLNGSSTSGNLISQNSFYNNGINGDALGIDLNSDGVTINDTGDADGGPNGSINFPIIETAYKSGSNIVITGWSRPGATIEFFLTDINQGTATAGDNQLGLSVDYGEGQVFLASVIEGGGSDTNSASSLYLDDDSNTDNTNKFTFTFSVPSTIILGDDLTATATIANATSEFSPFSKLRAFTIITNRRITHRVKKN